MVSGYANPEGNSRTLISVRNGMETVGFSWEMLSVGMDIIQATLGASKTQSSTTCFSVSRMETGCPALGH